MASQVATSVERHARGEAPDELLGGGRSSVLASIGEWLIDGDHVATNADGESVSVEVLDAAEVRRRAPYVAGERLAGGTFGARDGFTDPGGPLGDSLGSAVTRLTRESGKMEA